MRVLELFKGTGSVTKYCEARGWEVVSVDIDPQFEATYTCDILDFEYTAFPVGHFDIVWASPECKVYPSMQYVNIGRSRYKTREDLERAQRDHYKYTDRVLEIIEYLEPALWYIENPLASQLRKHPVLRRKPCMVCDYCRFGCDHKKPTRIWTNSPRADVRCVCTERHACKVANNKGDGKGLVYLNNNLRAKYAVPDGLIGYLFRVAQKGPPQMG
jgi:hypothetical protein